MVTQTLTVLTKGWTYLDWGLVLLCLGLWPLGSLMLISFVASGDSALLLPKVIAAGILALAVGFFAESANSVRRVDIDPRGVAFRYLFSTDFAPWSDLKPSPLPVKHGLWGFARVRGEGGWIPRQGHIVTIEQARAVLSSMSCPTWEIPDVTLRKLGLSPRPRES